MKNILKYIPGFRSSVKWKKVLATIYYLFALLMLIGGLDLFIFLLAIPGVIFSIGNLIKARKNNKPIKAIMLALVVSLGAVVGSLSYSDPTVEVMKELDQPSDAGLVDEESKDQVEVVNKEETDENHSEKEELELPSDVEIAAEEKQEEIIKEDFEEVHKLKVHYLEVGQGDSIFIQLPNGETALIDGGTRSNGYIVLDYLSQQKIETIDYLVATHPHEDHIGGLIEVINKHNIGKIYMPKIGHTTKAFEDLLLAIRNKDKKLTSAKAGDRILDKEGLNLEILAPEENENDSNLNNHSIVIRLEYKDNSFLFTGDGEKESESKMVNGGYNLRSDVLKLGHHGSNTSTSDSFLNKVEPKYAVISCGAGNSYGHPNDDIMNKLNGKGIEIFRTDLDGTVVATSDGEQITFDTKGTNIKSKKSVNIENSQAKVEKTSQVKPPQTDQIEEVYITNTGTKYHKATCSSVSKSKIPISLAKAKESYGPCQRCKP